MILGNKLITVAFVSWFIAQFIKVLLVLISEKKLDFRKFIETGGMPSSHSSLVVGLTTAVGKLEGLNSTAFAISSILAVIVMYDAAGVRRAAGRQAKVLNSIIDELYRHKPKVDEKLKELLGHTPIEVIAGAALGLIVGLLL